MRKKGKAFVKEIALERIYRLFELADKAFGKENSERANRYIELALKISSRNKATVPAELKTSFCKKCHCFLKKGKNAKLKKTDRWVEVNCKQCGTNFKRQLLHKE
ncbi:MAG: ribonuclease P [archaeon]|jgi:ribonuclease P protein subunit RPR2|nr:ribonuclease P [archaeon]